MEKSIITIKHTWKLRIIVVVSLSQVSYWNDSANITLQIIDLSIYGLNTFRTVLKQVIRQMDYNNHWSCSLFSKRPDYLIGTENKWIQAQQHWNNRRPITQTKLVPDQRCISTAKRPLNWVSWVPWKNRSFFNALTNNQLLLRPVKR